MYQQTGPKCTVDSVFRCKNAPYLIKLQQDDSCVHGHGLDENEALMIARKQHAATSMHQAAEWGMHAFQSMFPRVKDTIIYEENK